MSPNRIMPNRIMIVDDHPLFRDALRLALSAANPDYSFQEAASLDDLLQQLKNGEEPDLVLLDLKMPGVQGFAGLVYLRGDFPQLPVAIVSGSDDAQIIRRAIDLGAAGFIPKSTAAAKMREAVEALLKGSVWLPQGLPEVQDTSELTDLSARMKTLTPQQTRVLIMLQEGLLNKQIAFNLEVSEATIKAHVSAILQKLNVDSRTQAVIAAAKLNGE